MKKILIASLVIISVLLISCSTSSPEVFNNKETTERREQSEQDELNATSPTKKVADDIIAEIQRKTSLKFVLTDTYDYIDCIDYNYSVDDVEVAITVDTTYRKFYNFYVEAPSESSKNEILDIITNYLNIDIPYDLWENPDDYSSEFSSSEENYRIYSSENNGIIFRSPNYDELLGHFSVEMQAFTIDVIRVTEDYFNGHSDNMSVHNQIEDIISKMEDFQDSIDYTNEKSIFTYEGDYRLYFATSWLSLDFYMESPATDIIEHITEIRELLGDEVLTPIITEE